MIKSNYIKQLIKYFFWVKLFIGSYILCGQPVITSFSPISGTTGSIIIIKGSNFSNVPENNIVFFGPVKAVVNWSTTDSLAATVPLGSTYELLRITVNNLTAFSARKFLPVTNNEDSITISSFAPKVDYTAPNYPFSIAISDLDSDGKADVITGNYSSSNITIFKNYFTSEISLVSTLTLTTSNKPTNVKAGDIDGDGKPDIVTSNDVSQKLSVFINTSSAGNISFSPKQDFPTGVYAVDVALGDIDNDGKIDLIEINNQQKTVSVLRNTGSVGILSFASAVSFATGTAPSHVYVIDLNADGKQDILVTNQYDSTISIFKNTSVPGSISFLPRVNFPTGYRPLVVDIGDLNNDNLPDIVTGSQDSSIAILTNISTGSTFNFSLENKLIGVTPQSVSISDIDGDGKPDLSLAGSETNISVLQNTSSGTNITFANRILFSMGGSSYENKIADINNDGRGDLVIVHSNKLGILKNTMPVNLFFCPNSTNATIHSNATGSSYQWQVNWGSAYGYITDNSFYSGTTTQTLQLNSFSSVWYGAKYRCLVSGGIYSDEFILKFRDMWTGNISNDWENPSNWSCMVTPDANTDVQINSGTVVINSNVTIRSLKLRPGVNLTVSPGYSLTILH